ncbi:MAG: uracil-DNA glycosylase [Acidobacteriota bacterium]
MDRSTSELFEALCLEAQICRNCPALADKRAVLSELNGCLDPKVMFIGEAPGRVGADRTRRPFFGDKSGENFQLFLDSISLSRDEIFITSAVMCSPRSATDANRRPTRGEILNCSQYLKKVVDLLDPPVIATLGGVALEAIRSISYHEFKLKTHAAKVLKWDRRLLVPLYHPSPQVLAGSRRMQEQLKDYKVLAKVLPQNGSHNS